MREERSEGDGRRGVCSPEIHVQYMTLYSEERGREGGREGVREGGV